MTRTTVGTLKLHAPRGHALRDVFLVAALLVGIAAFVQAVRF